MSSYQQTYTKAYQKYVSGDYSTAATLIDPLIEENPENPNVRLLRGHIYSGLQQYDIALSEYQVLQGLTTDENLLECAHQGIINCQEYAESAADNFQSGPSTSSQNSGPSFTDDRPNFDDPELHGTWAGMEIPSDDELNFSHFDLDSTEGNGFAHSGHDDLTNDPFLTPVGSQYTDDQASNPFGDNPFDQSSNEFQETTSDFVDPFAANPADNWDDQGLSHQNTSWNQGTPSQPLVSNDDEKTLFIPPSDSELAKQQIDSFDPMGMADSPMNPGALPNFEDPLAMGDDPFNGHGSSDDMDWMMNTDPTTTGSAAFSPDEDGEETFAMSGKDGESMPMLEDRHPTIPPQLVDDTDFQTEGTTSAAFLDEFEDFGDFDNLANFEINDNPATFVSQKSGESLSSAPSKSSELVDFSDSTSANLPVDNPWAGDDLLPSFTQGSGGDLEPSATVEQGVFAFFDNAPFDLKRLYTSLFTACSTALVIGIVNLVSAPSIKNSAQDNADNLAGQLIRTGWMMALAGGISGFGTTFLAGDLILRQFRLSTNDLKLQMGRVTQGDFTAQSTVYTEDEMGQLATAFNQMSRVILTTTKEAQRKAEEQEQQKDDLQRQVIRLLDDVEGAARGDLTVQAEVTADVLGAVADSFNLTIQNLQQIVFQVKQAAIQVNKASSDNETFARSLSSDALRQAEELAVTLNSVQVMTDSIQRVAESAREAEEVARTASATALKGGEAVEQTVAGILRIRETVAETTRKVKRLAESSQEISKIVALISAIASRTNLLALNASIEAARAGESGKGFAIVADEVRQLADRAAKASKEIEQIVLQIQSETGSVMTAMEEGTQQVIEGTKLAEQAKRSLEDIIQVSNRIDQLVRSITQDTVEQTETSRAVAQVMQSVELTAQETSQEAQRVSRSLQNLVGVARDLQTSVERFRVEA